MCCLTAINRNLIAVAFFPLHISDSGKTSSGALLWSGRVAQCHSLSTTTLPAWLLSYQCASLESISLQPVSGRIFSPPEWHSWGFWWHMVEKQRDQNRELKTPMANSHLIIVGPYNIHCETSRIWAWWNSVCPGRWLWTHPNIRHVRACHYELHYSKNAKMQCFLKESGGTYWRKDYSTGHENIPPTSWKNTLSIYF